MQKLNIPIKRWRNKSMNRYFIRFEIDNFCLNDLLHDYNSKLHLQMYKVEERTFGTPCILKFKV